MAVEEVYFLHSCRIWFPVLYLASALKKKKKEEKKKKNPTTWQFVHKPIFKSNFFVV